MAHSLTPGSTAPFREPGPNQPALDADAVWEARADLAACFRMAAPWAGGRHLQPFLGAGAGL